VCSSDLLLPPSVGLAIHAPAAAKIGMPSPL
jgi:hypothetical protein